MLNKELPPLVDNINRLPQIERRVLFTGRNEPGQLPSNEKTPNPFMDRRQSDQILLAHVRACFASFDNEAKQRYITDLLHNQDFLTAEDIEKMLGLTSSELAKLRQELD